MRKLLFLLLFATAMHAQAPSTFREGVLAFENKDWKEAERLMRATIAVNPNETEGTVSIAGSWFETYVPHYFLARALARQGKCDEALKEFAETERQGVTPAIGDFARHLQTRGGCKPQAKPAKPKEVVIETTVPFGEEQPPAPAPAPAPAPHVPVVDHTATRLTLRAAVNSYVHGRYEEAARVLTQAKFDDPAAAGEAALLRAAARHALYRSGGEKDKGLRAQIDADLRMYRELRPNGRPDPRLFPPSFVALVAR
ncbi:MAG: tetratricopeptide repeat protein [Thermoanaerobaculia bacterium]